MIENVTLDGVMQAPGRPDEDPSDGFAHGGWAVRYDMGEGMEPGAAALLFGRCTYNDSAGYRPHRTDGNTFTPVLDAAQEYLVSDTVHDPLPWRNSGLVQDLDGVAALRERHHAPVVLGSRELVRALMRQDLPDVLVVCDPPAGARLGPSPVRRPARAAAPGGPGHHVDRRDHRDPRSREERLMQ